MADTIGFVLIVCLVEESYVFRSIVGRIVVRLQRSKLEWGGGTKDFFPLKRDIHEPPYFLDSVLVVKPGASAGAGRYIPGTLWTNNKIVMNNIEKTTYS